ncbi:UDP-N-acetylhexosamine pyrophosphorylase-like isoform X2 [Convolutriloba macropyga]|uniref:UDP-N-acetylhexosamine pyrophosphorylase-like isoform X2 n=1 Tax=Convolutriloba macropyga TaxID=536237 RepID=UPI003F527CD6
MMEINGDHALSNGQCEQSMKPTCTESELRDKLTRYEQSHLMQFYDELNEQDQQKLLADISTVDFDDVNQFFDAKYSTTEACRLSPVEKDITGSVHDANASEYRDKGLSVIAANKVCVLLLAGGQGTRLGVTYPKGMYNVGLPSGKTLYQIQAERILKIQQLADSHAGHTSPRSVVPWYIMTSEHTKEATQEFFESKDYFGLDKNNVVFFEQNMIPCIDFEGKILLESKCKLARSPDGNGGLYRAMNDCHILDDMEKRGIEHINIYGVDNILVRVADPMFIGFAIIRDAECANKVLLKKDPHEKVGVVCKVDQQYKVVEYSEIPKEVSEMRDPESGKLLYGASNIVNHYLSFQFAKTMCKDEASLLLYHEARKKIPYIDVLSGKLVENPSSNTGIKREKFVFDVFPYAKKFAMLEVNREDEFAPLKNANAAGTECPDTSRDAIYTLHSKWVIQNGGAITTSSPTGPVSNGDGCPEAKSSKSLISDLDSLAEAGALQCEVSPLVSYAGEGLETLCKDQTFSLPVQLS